MKTTCIAITVVLFALLSLKISSADDRPQWASNNSWIRISDNFGFIITKTPIEPIAKKETREDGSTSVKMIEPGNPKSSGYFVMKKNGKWFPVYVENPILTFPVDK